MSGMSAKRTVAVIAFGLLVGLAGGPRTASASRADRLTYLTFSTPVALPGVTLAPGRYAFELAMPYTSSNVVLVREGSRTGRPLFSGFTYRAPRPANWSEKRQIVLGEAGPGEARPILAWYPVDNAMGFEFIYRP